MDMPFLKHAFVLFDLGLLTNSSAYILYISYYIFRLYTFLVNIHDTIGTIKQFLK